MKKVIIIIGVLVGLFLAGVIFLMGLLYLFDKDDSGARSPEIKNTETDNTVNDKQETIKDLKIFDLEKKGDNLVGKIKNTTGKEIDYLEIKFEFLDKDKIIIADDFTNKTDFRDGDTWQFKIYLIEEDYDSYRYEISEGF